MADDEAAQIFLDSVDPVDPARREWAARWLNLARTPGTRVADFCARFHALLEEAVPGGADKLERTWAIKVGFAER
ncbi:hypothetical protein H9P43_006653 [Blastocladiella emersonii ATCC 22665]|nr:hypothetical protein H9P43_007416 [Blastocladiella emersonii ATCC 22665]KAI9175292.1 hypothetical protein H9P43_006653 [Blastocladiella emersonii ATCC 22665]